MVQPVKCTLHKREGLSLDPQHPRERSQALWGQWEGVGEDVHADPGSLLTSLATSEPASKIKVKNNQGRH